MLNPFIACVCVFTYLSSSMKITADMSSSSHPCCLVTAVVNHTHEHINIHVQEYTEHFKAYTDLEEPGCDKHGVNDT